MDESTFWSNTLQHQILAHNAGYTDDSRRLAASLQGDLNFVYHENFIFTSDPPGLKLSIPIPAI